MGGPVAIALDLATRTGFAVGTIAAGPAPTPLERSGGAVLPKVISGTESFARHSGNHGSLYAAFDEWLGDMIAVHQPTYMAFEAPVPIHKSINASRIAFGLAAHVERIAKVRGVRLWEVHVADVKKHATGKGNADKAAMMAAARERGWRFGDDNEADALWLLDYAIACWRSQRRGGA